MCQELSSSSAGSTPHDHESNGQTIADTLDLRRREITDQQRLKFEGYAAEIFAALGMNLNTPATADTPRRFIRYLRRRR